MLFVFRSASLAKSQPMVKRCKPPMLRAKTLPAIIPPSLNIIQAQLDTPIEDRDNIAGQLS